MIMAGFTASTSEDCLVVASSSPFVKPSVLFQLFESIRGYDAAIPRWKNGATEPLLAVYKRRAFLKAAAGLQHRTLNSLIGNLYDVAYVGVEDLISNIDPDLDSFFRIKKESDLAKARVIASAKVLQ